MIAIFKNSVEFANNLKAALRAASTDPTRTNQQCVRIELDTESQVARFVATCGHWIWINEIAVSGDVAGVDDKGRKLYAAGESTIVHIASDDVKDILKALEKSKKAQSWELQIDTAKRTVRQLSKEVGYSQLDITFPPYAQIVPAVVLNKAPAMSYDPAYLAAVSESFADVAATAKSIGVKIEPTGGELDPVVITSPSAGRALVVLMPRRQDGGAASLLVHYRAAKTQSGKAA